MPRRPEQLAQELRDLVATVLTEQIEFPEGVFVTVTRAEVAGNRRSATVYVSVLPPEQGPRVLTFLRPRLYEIQGAVYERLDRHPGPRIRLALDPGTPSPP